MNLRAAVCVFFTIFLSSNLARAAETADEVVRKADDARGLESAHSFTARVKNFKGTEMQDNTYRVSVNGLDLSLIEQKEPQRLIGRKLLMREHDLWLYTPEMRRPTRIGFEQRLTGEVANGDLARTRFSQDYSATLSEEQPIGGKACFKMHLTAKSKDATYRQIDYWVEKGTYFPRQALFYAISGKLLKTATYSDFGPVLGRQRLTKTVIQDSVQPSKRSILTYTGYRAESFTDRDFSKESLGN